MVALTPQQSSPTRSLARIFVITLAVWLVCSTAEPVRAQIRLNGDVLVASAPGRRAPAPAAGFDGRQLEDVGATLPLPPAGADDSALRGRHDDSAADGLLGTIPSGTSPVPALDVAEPHEDDELANVAQPTTTTGDGKRGIGAIRGEGEAARRPQRRRRTSERDTFSQLRDQGRRQQGEYPIRRANETPGKRLDSRRRTGGNSSQSRGEEQPSGAITAEEEGQLPVPPGFDAEEMSRWQVAEAALRVLLDEDDVEVLPQRAPPRSLEEISEQIDRHDAKFRQLSELLSALLGQNTNNRRNNNNQQPGDIIGGMQEAVDPRQV